MPNATDLLDEQLLVFEKGDAFTIRDACQGVQIFGETGSGKTSGSGSLLARAYLAAGFGGIVLTAKPDELHLWLTYAAKTARLDDVVVFGEGSPHRFNILRYECDHDVGGLGLTWNLVELFMTLNEIASRGGGHRASANESFWRNELQKLLANCIESLRLSRQPISFQNINQILWSAPMEPTDFASEDWRQRSYCFQLNAAIQKRSHACELTSVEEGDWNATHDYWVNEFPRMPENTRANIVSSLTGMITIFDRGMLRELLSTTTTVTPEDSFDGKIIILNLPAKRFDKAGIYTQAIFKYCWQRAVERRAVSQVTRPVFVWADEAQLFVNEHDTTFQTTARSSRACTVFLTQNLPNYHYYLGGDERARSLTKSLLGNLTTKIFHNNSCVETNRYASDLFSKTWRDKPGYSTSERDGRVDIQHQHRHELVDQVIPHEFTSLATGGPANDFLVEGIIHQAGRKFKTSNTNSLKVYFRQTS